MCRDKTARAEFAINFGDAALRVTRFDEFHCVRAPSRIDQSCASGGKVFPDAAISVVPLKFPFRVADPAELRVRPHSTCLNFFTPLVKFLQRFGVVPFEFGEVRLNGLDGCAGVGFGCDDLFQFEAALLAGDVGFELGELGLGRANGSDDVGFRQFTPSGCEAHQFGTARSGNGIGIPVSVTKFSNLIKHVRKLLYLRVAWTLFFSRLHQVFLRPKERRVIFFQKDPLPLGVSTGPFPARPCQQFLFDRFRVKQEARSSPKAGHTTRVRLATKPRRRHPEQPGSACQR